MFASRSARVGGRGSWFPSAEATPPRASAANATAPTARYLNLVNVDPFLGWTVHPRTGRAVFLDSRVFCVAPQIRHGGPLLGAVAVLTQTGH